MHYRHEILVSERSKKLFLWCCELLYVREHILPIRPGWLLGRLRLGGQVSHTLELLPDFSHQHFPLPYPVLCEPTADNFGYFSQCVVKMPKSQCFQMAGLEAADRAGQLTGRVALSTARHQLLFVLVIFISNVWHFFRNIRLFTPKLSAVGTVSDG